MEWRLRLKNLAIRIKIPRPKGSAISRAKPLVRAAVAAVIIVCTLFFGVFTFYYVKYQKVIDKRMNGVIFANTGKIYAQPRTLRVGQKADPHEIATYLHHAGYGEAGVKGESSLGNYRVVGGGIEIKPGRDSYYNSEGAAVRMQEGHIERITGRSESV